MALLRTSESPLSDRSQYWRRGLCSEHSARQEGPRIPENKIPCCVLWLFFLPSEQQLGTGEEKNSLILVLFVLEWNKIKKHNQLKRSKLLIRMLKAALKLFPFGARFSKLFLLNVSHFSSKVAKYKCPPGGIVVRTPMERESLEALSPVPKGDTPGAKEVKCIDTTTSITHVVLNIGWNWWEAMCIWKWDWWIPRFNDVKEKYK